MHARGRSRRKRRVLAYEVWRGLLLLVRVAPARVVSVAHASVASADSG